MRKKRRKATVTDGCVLVLKEKRGSSVSRPIELQGDVAAATDVLPYQEENVRRWDGGMERYLGLQWKLDGLAGLLILFIPFDFLRHFLHLADSSVKAKR
jgi:hypothetical protein